MELEMKCNLKPKMVKLVEDPCFGLMHEQTEQCNACWVKKSCATSFRNAEAKKKKELESNS